MHVHTDAMRVRSGNIIRFDPTMTAKVMFRDASVEGVGRESVLALQQAEIGVGYDQVQEARLATDAAIAISSLDNRRRINLKSQL